MLESMAENLVGKIATCSICGKEKTIENQCNKVRGQGGIINILECKDCAGAG
jgi:predicted nucleic acid binding AN1-type Zn finger protein